MTTFNFPLTTLAVGIHDLGPASVADTDTKILITNDRTVANGLNSQPATTTIEMDLFQSSDGGATWHGLAENGLLGGIYPGKGGVGQINTDHLGTQLNPGTGRQVKATLTVSGASVAVAGSITTQ